MIIKINYYNYVSYTIYFVLLVLIYPLEKLSSVADILINHFIHFDQVFVLFSFIAKY